MLLFLRDFRAAVSSPLEMCLAIGTVQWRRPTVGYQYSMVWVSWYILAII